MNFNLPKFVEFYKFLLVDELVLCDNPFEIHYGHCSVIGYLSKNDQLSSLKIPHLPREYQLDDCSLSIKVMCDFDPVNHLQTTVEIFGEVRLMNVDNDKDLQTSHSLIARLGNLQIELEELNGLKKRQPSGTCDKSLLPHIRRKLEMEIEQIKNSYQPFIKVHTIRNLQNSREILVENLKFRKLQMIKKS